MTIPLFIPSKNRAPQLRLLLESISKNMPGVFQPHILWTADEKRAATYLKLGKEDLGMPIIWENEYNFVEQFYDIIKFHELGNGGGYIAFAMDDCICYRKAEFSEQDILGCFGTWQMEDKVVDPVWSVSLRLGKNTILHDYLRGVYQQPIDPVFETENKQFVGYEFRKHRGDMNYGFQFSWDGQVYRTKDLLSLMGGTDFRNTENKNAIVTQRIENFMMHTRDKVPYQLMCCPQNSHFVCMNWNDTHPNGNPGQKFGCSLDILNELYMQDYVIDLDSIDFNNPPVVSCHDERSFACRRL